MKNIAILTPTYNRAHTLPRLYDSLCNQENKEFIWYLIDDGSTDSTEKLIKSFKDENIIEINYYKKTNGGKHTALNEGLKHIKEKLTFIVDSDDFLPKDSVQTILNDSHLIEENNLFALSYLRQTTNFQCIGHNFPKDYQIDTFINMRYNQNTFGDKAEVYVTDILKKYPFPIFDGERFLSESTIWCQISGPYKMIFINKAIYTCEYQDNGLTSNVHKTLFNNPKGSALCYKVMSSKEFKISKQIKHQLLYICYSVAAKYSLTKIIQDSPSKTLTIALLPFGFGIFCLKKIKY